MGRTLESCGFQIGPSGRRWPSCRIWTFRPTAVARGAHHPPAPNPLGRQQPPPTTPADRKSSFRQLILEKGFAAVTVKELCERARINKKAFYCHYPAIEYLLAEVQAQYSQPDIERIAGLSFPENAEVITRAFFEFSVAQTSFMRRSPLLGGTTPSVSG
ncbi:TetR/AcrR family transcriptional regulator [Actinomyces sp. 594]|nr:TetR/AcrR family transcriptional regulator [Actinomyces sp. 594]